MTAGATPPTPASFPSRTATCYQVHGAGFRAVYDLADLDRSRFIQAVGQSGNIFSPHYGDLAPLWAKGGTFTLGPLQDQPVSVLTLLPE